MMLAILKDHLFPGGEAMAAVCRWGTYAYSPEPTDEEIVVHDWMLRQDSTGIPSGKKIIVQEIEGRNVVISAECN